MDLEHTTASAENGERLDSPVTIAGPSHLTFTWRRAAWSFLATLLAVNVVLVLGIRTARWDAIDFFCPYYTLVADAARQGQLVLWAPWINAGCPMGLEPQVGAASPVQVGLGFITGGNEFGFRLYWILLWCLGGSGVLVLAHHLRASPSIACVCAIGYTFSAIYMSHAEHTSYLVVMSWFPWALWRLDVALCRRSLFPALQAGALWGLSALGGYPGLVLGGAGYAVAWSLGRLLFDPVQQSKPFSPILNAAFVIATLSVFFATGFAVLSPTYVGFLTESQGYTSRANQMPREVPMVQGALPPAALATFASPYLAIWNFKSNHPLWSLDVSMVSIYLLPLLLVLALSVEASGPSNRLVWFLRCLALFYLLLAMGGATPLYGWLYDLLPPIRFLRFAAIFRCFYLLTIVVIPLLALGSPDRLFKGDAANAFWRRAVRTSLVAAAIAFPAFGTIAWLSAGGQDRTLQLLAAIAHLLVIWSVVTLLLSWGYRSNCAVRRRIVYRYFVFLAIGDAIFTLALSESMVYGNPAPWHKAAANHVVSLDLTRRGLDRQLSTDTETLPLNNNLISKTLTLNSYVGLINRFHDEYARHRILGPSILGSQRIWFSPRAVQVPLAADSFLLFVAAVERLGKPCIVWSDRKERTRLPSENTTQDLLARESNNLAYIPPAESLPVTLSEYSPNRLAFEVNASSDGWLLVTDRWAPGWQATVNSKNIDLPIGNFIFRAVPVRQGTNLVDFCYRPFGHPWLLLLSWTTLGTVLTATVATHVINRRTDARRRLE